MKGYLLIHRYDTFKPRSKDTSLLPNLMLSLPLLFFLESPLVPLCSFRTTPPFDASDSESLVAGDLCSNSSPIIARMLSGRSGATAINW